MDERRANHERLPWLEPVAPGPAGATTAAMRSRMPLLVLLALLMSATIAMMAFLAGRTTAPDERRKSAEPAPTVQLPAMPASPEPTLPPVGAQSTSTIISASAAPDATPARVHARRASSSHGGVVQLGAYLSKPTLDSAWRRLVGAYPRLGTMPRTVTGIALPGRPYYYRLRVATGSPREAGALCDQLHRVGRGCMPIGNPW